MIKSYRKGYLKVDDIHSIYFECYGVPQGKTVFIFHGGPGYGCDIEMLEPFDLNKWNVVMFDQRGCGRSTPKGCIKSNCTDLLIEDVKKLAIFLEINRFAIKGESWGTTLGLLFAEKYPEFVSSMILTGVFLGNNDGTLLGKNGGFEKFYPELWDDYLKLLPINKRSKPYDAYYDYIINGTADEQYKYARELIFLELLMELPTLDFKRADTLCDELDVRNIAKIEVYYTMNDFFVLPNQIIANISKLSNIPVSIVQGRYDLITPIYSAWTLSKNLKNSYFHVLEFGGHSDIFKDTSVMLKSVANRHLQFM